MLFHSTRGGDKDKDFASILMQGLADDGGLFMPDHWPQVNLKKIKGLQSFVEVAKEIVPLFTASSFTQAETIKIGALPQPAAFRAWKNATRMEVVAASGLGEECYIWMLEVEEVGCKREKFRVSGKRFTRIDVKLGAALTKIATGDIGREITAEHEIAMREGRMLKGREILWIIY